ncbi:MAG TPA: YggS family pyridoxal phosphate-dependent enzyme [bacterium]|nr:YggS family pyridoxal phosphate-dependent enzyme [bacterium]
MAEIGANVARVRARIAEAVQRCGRRPEGVQLIAVTKTVGVDRIREAVACGLRVLGENRVQEARAKVPEVGGGVSWHLIGGLQRNKVKDALRLFQAIHSVDSLELAEEISRRGAQRGGDPVGVLIEVNISGESQKHGIAPGEAEGLVSRVMRLPGLRLRGMMGMAPLVETAEAARPFFRQLRELRDRIREALPDCGLDELSMGMTNDFEVAIEEGATMIRVGRALFA